MDEKFLAHVESLRPKLERLLAMPPVKPTRLPPQMPKAGVYVLSEAGRHLYVGRSNDIRGRIGRHSRPGATHRMAAFAFRLARESTGNLRASYKKGEGSRAGLMENPAFVKAFNSAKARICRMDLRYVEETDPVRQTLLEVYVAVVLEAKQGTLPRVNWRLGRPARGQSLDFLRTKGVTWLRERRRPTNR